MILTDSGYRQPLNSSLSTSLTPSNLQAIQNLISSASPHPSISSSLPSKSQAAVAILLFQPTPESIQIISETKSHSPSHTTIHEESQVKVPVPSDLQVILTTRSLNLRSHPGQASLPGGKVDRSDVEKGVEYTALRECHEEIGLDFEKWWGEGMGWVCTGQPFISKTSLLVHPSVFLLSSNPQTLHSILSSLSPSPSEVSKIWSNPFNSLLSSQPPNEWHSKRLSNPTKVDKHRKPQQFYRTYSDVPFLSLEGQKKEVRVHRFRSGEELIKGLTSDIILSLSTIAYHPPKFRISAPNQPSFDILRKLVIDRIRKGEKGEKRWGDGESGDGKERSEEFETWEGRDLEVEETRS